ncbi:GNAT family N-acetyltransferase [Kribbella sp. NPDC058245]|uniref:GNAT family N-acetyltransferase n=1 Tax=Kribbella sp. NPDC058245 TaxID=3346399 RepID=UPI0036E2806D
MNASVYRDAYGVPHLQAVDPLALVYLQGVNAAKDRAWQLEYERRRFLGTTAAFLGPEALPWDTFARQAQLADTVQRCFENLDAETQEWVTAYVEGVNHALPGGAARAPEFAQTGLRLEKWEPWAPLGIWLTIHILFAGFPSKLWRTHVAKHLGDDQTDLFTSEGPRTAGSNGWLVPGTATSTGQAVIAGDPHRFIESPGVYQQIRLACPEYDVLGLAIPGIPGLAHFGHAGKVAWSITNAMADYQDVYAEQIRRTGSSVQALGPDGWAPASRSVSVVEVAGAEPVEIELIETERGPVIGNGLSLRYPPRVLGRLGFEVFPKLLRATSVADLDAALEGWVEPVNVVLAADVDGGLLHRVAGTVPRRTAVNRQRVVPAWESGHQWDGWETMPHATIDGPEVMANARGISGSLGSEFASPHRADRIRSLLSARTDWTVKDMPEVHRDTWLGSAGQVLDLLDGLDELSAEAVALRKELLEWDRRMDATSSTASAYAAVRKAIVSRLTDHFAVLENGEVPEVFRPWMDPLNHVAYGLENLLAADLPDVNQSWIAREALEEVAARGPRPPWGETHQIAPLHPLDGPIFAPDEEPIDLGLSGDHHCVMSTSSVPGLTDICLRASAARYAWDLADRSAGAWVVPLGASGILGDAHHHDQLPLWLRGDLAPIVTDWDQLHRDERTYTAEVEGFGTIRIIESDPDRDLDLIRGWVTAERAGFWGMGDLSDTEIGDVYRFLDSVPTHHVFLVHLDDVPVALFQTYDPQADPIGTTYDIQAGDIGVHFLIAPGDPRPGFTGTLLHAIGNYLLVDQAHPRLVSEPDTRNTRAIARLHRTGFILGPEVQVPLVASGTKTARLAFLTRESFTAAGATTEPATANSATD